MARGWHSLSSALLLFFCGIICIFLLVLLFLSFCFVFVMFLCSRWSFVNVPLIFPADHLRDWQPDRLICEENDNILNTRDVMIL